MAKPKIIASNWRLPLHLFHASSSNHRLHVLFPWCLISISAILMSMVYSFDGLKFCFPWCSNFFITNSGYKNSMVFDFHGLRFCIWNYDFRPYGLISIRFCLSTLKTVFFIHMVFIFIPFSSLHPTLLN